MLNRAFKNYIDTIKYGTQEDFDMLKCCGYYVLQCTDKQLLKLVDTLIKYRGYEVVDNCVTFAGLEINITRKSEVI